MKTNKNEVYVLKQPTHSILSVITVNIDNFPIEPSIHQSLEELSEFSDIVFIYSDKFFPECESVDKNKLASLYGAIAWIEAADSLPKTLFKVFEYSKEIFEREAGYMMINLSDILNLKISDFKSKSIDLTISGVNTPIFKINRLSSEEFFNIYKKVSEKSIFDLVKKKPEVSPDVIDMFCSYTSESNILYFKNTIINLLLNFYKEDVTRHYVESFNERSDLRYLLASLVKYLGIDTIPENIENLELPNL